MATFTSTMYCPTCKRTYTATVVTRRVGKEEGRREISPCPKCRTPGQVPVAV